MGQSKKAVAENIVKALEGRYNLTHCGAVGKPSPLHIRGEPRSRDASKPALAKAREFLTFQPTFAIDRIYAELQQK